MNLQQAKAKWMVVSNFHLHKLFYSHNDIVFEQEGKQCLHTFNYLFQDIADKPYLLLNTTCIIYNTLVFEKEAFGFDAALTYLKEEGFDQFLSEKELHEFNNENLQMDFYPAIKGNYLKDNEGKHFMLIALQKYQSEDFTTPLLFQFTEPSFRFPHQDNYFKD